MTAKKVIPFEYCPLERAAKFFNCEVDDFFHWWETGKIDLCFNFNQLDSVKLLSIDGDTIEYSYGRTAYEESQSSKYHINDEEFAGFLSEDVKKNDRSGAWDIIGEAWGLWKPAPVVLERIKEGYEFKTGFWVQAYGVEYDLRLFIDGEVKADRESIVIPKVELEKIQLILTGQFEDEDLHDNQELLLVIASMLKSVVSPNAKKWSQGDIAIRMSELGIKGLKERKINDIFAKANKLYKSIN